MSKGHWTKHEKIEIEILDILKIQKLASVNIILFELTKKGYNVSYGLVARRMRILMDQEEVDFMNVGASKIRLWSINRNLF